MCMHNIADNLQIWKKMCGNSAQNLVLETTFKPFGLIGWLKVSYLLDYII